MRRDAGFIPNSSMEVREVCCERFHLQAVEYLPFLLFKFEVLYVATNIFSSLVKYLFVKLLISFVSTFLLSFKNRRR